LNFCGDRGAPIDMTAEPRPRILIITRNLPPLVGGMERLNWHMAEELAKVAEVRIVGPEGSAALAPVGIAVREAPLKPLWKFLWRARALGRREARIWKPDLVLAGSGLTAPIVRSAASVCGAKTAVYVHGLDVAVRHPGYRAIWLRALRRMDRVIANSHATEALCRTIGIDAARIGVVHPGVDLPPDPIANHQRGHPEADPQARNRESSTSFVPEMINATFRQRYQLANRPLLLSVGRLSERKGLREFVAQCLPCIVAAHPDVMLLIVGDAPKDALHARAQSPESIRAVAARVGVTDNLLFLGTITDYNELGEVYRAADLHVFPVREIPNDPEGFGMVAVEAAAHALPTVAFATGGVSDAVAEGQSGRLVLPGDYAGFANAVLDMLIGHESLRASCIDFSRQFAWSEFGAQVRDQLSLAGPDIPAPGENA
jgi:phosphatidylinositol alpha-1,6-mannosyltransferase